MLSLVVLLLSTTTFMSSADAQQVTQVPTYFDFHPASSMTVKRGLDPNDMSIPKSICIDADINDADNAAALVGSLDIDYVMQASQSATPYTSTQALMQAI